MKPINHLHLLILMSIRALTLAYRYPPTVLDLVDLTKIGAASGSGITWRLDQLADRGLVERERSKARTIRLTERGEVLLATRLRRVV